ncbi:long-chain fatty acid--CoA ligase [soil metagenome]
MSLTSFPAAGDPLRYWSRLQPNRVALVDRSTGRRWSYAQLSLEADRWANELLARGVEPGDRVALLAGNRAEAIHIFFACGRIGCALIPLNWRLAPAEIRPIVADAAPTLVLAESRFAEALADKPLDLETVAEAAALRPTDPPPPAPVQPETPWLILYTSGSTGSPKGAILPHRQILFNAIATSIGWSLGASDVAPISTPLFHTGGWNVSATPLWFVGGTVVLFESFEPAAFLAGLAQEGCTLALTVPTQLLMLTESADWGKPLPRLRHFISGGAPCPATLTDAVRSAGYHFREGYGLTECGPNCFASSDEVALRQPGSVGTPIPFLEVRLEGEDGTEVPVDETGELLLRGPQLFGGYLGRPDLTEAACSDGGWLRTGDLASRDENDIFRIRGRKKEMYISGGENVYPAEVEAALCELSGILEAVVIGVPDERWGEVGAAYVVPRQGAPLRESEVLAHTKLRLAGYKRPSSVTIVPEIPRLGSGKPDRAALINHHLPPAR